MSDSGTDSHGHAHGSATYSRASGDAFFKEIATALHDRHEITHPTIQIDPCRLDRSFVAPKLD